MVRAAGDGGGGLDEYLGELAERHSSRDLGIGAELYDYWLDSLLEAVKETDPQNSEQVRTSWERVMMVGINYLLSKY
jgi:hemoglobin-like flavoprotein